ncbi:MAG: adenylosuccinate lyase [Planctomycetales bacterium]|nr:adenylosuccinate lyase [Planctomycetales bacterium]
MSENFVYDNPLISRYASREMSRLWSTEERSRLWRQLWIILAECEQELGLPITDQQIEQMKQHETDIDLQVVREYERRQRHDVMAHVHAFGEQCPDARGIIHWGATSCYVTDNADLVLIRRGLELVVRRLAGVISQLAEFAKQHRALPCLAFTHLQPAQPTTVGKRACLWTYDLVLDLAELEHRLGALRARSAKGTTGTQASFLQLFDGDHEKVRQLEARIAQRLEFPASYAVTGQTYPRKVDAMVLDSLSGVAQSVHKIATDLRLLSSWKELEEPFEAEQIGSSAMAYKRNPMRSERMCSLARFVMSLQSSAAQTAAVQWMERTLDDSANRRLVIPQAFLAVDACLVLLQNVSSAMVVYPKQVEKRLAEELPFMATEAIMMAAVAQGADRQHVHELIRQHSVAAGLVVKQEGKPNDLIARLKSESALSQLNIDALIDPNAFVGRAPEQVDEFIGEIVEPIRQKYGDSESLSAEVNV